MSGPANYKALLIEAATRYAAQGWQFFLCGRDKKPLQAGGFKNASSDLNELKRAIARHPDGMLAVRTGAESGIVVVDIDVDEAKGINGREWLEESRTRGMTPCPIVQTPRGGVHLYFAHPGGIIQNSVGQLAKGVDVRGDGGYVIAPPSVSSNGEYSWRSASEIKPPPLPDWLLAEMSKGESEYLSGDLTPPGVEDQAEIGRQVEAALARVRDAEEGARNHTLNQNAFLIGKIVGAGGLSHAEALDRLIGAALSVGLPALEARRTAESGLRAGAKRPWTPRAADPLLNDLNRDHFYALEGRVGFVFREDRDSLTDRAVLQHISPGAFREQYGNQWLTVQGEKGPKKVPLGDAWMKWPTRRQYDKVVFAPGKELPPNTYNLWQGLAAEAISGKCDLFLDFLRQVICSNQVDLFEYLASWMARAVQEPWKPGEVAVVLRGEKGTGKTFFVDHFGELFGEHYVQMSNSHHLVGNFNAHLETAIVAFADEAFWAGDKQGEGTLKTLITGKVIRIERKGIDSKAAPNYVHLIMASNSDWVVPASADERRYFVLDVSDARRQDTAYFEQVATEWEAGGREAVLHMLVTRDLSGFNVRKAPTTEALTSQKLLSLQPVDRWYLGMLRDGINESDSWKEWVSTYTLWLSFTSWCEEENARIGTKEAFGMRLSKLLPPPATGASRRRQHQSPNSGKRLWGYEFPDLEECRRHFERVTAMSIEWGQEGEVNERPPRPSY